MTGTANYMLDPDDPFPEGFIVGTSGVVLSEGSAVCGEFVKSCLPFLIREDILLPRSAHYLWPDLARKTDSIIGACLIDNL